MRGTLTWAANSSSGSSREPTEPPDTSRTSIVATLGPLLPVAALDRRPDLDQPSGRARHGALEEQQIQFGVGLDDLEVQDRHAGVPVLARHAHAPEDAGRRGGRPHGARGAVLALGA